MIIIPYCSSHCLGVRDDFMSIREELTVLTFTSGTSRGPTSRRCRAIPVIDDDAVESSETFNAVLNRTAEDFAVVNLSNGLQSATVTILEDNNDREYKLWTECSCLPYVILPFGNKQSCFRYDSQSD